jgi:hypothetical protein
MLKKNVYYSSISREIEAVKDRVRSLIGSAHWPSDGWYKEVVLSNVIRRFLPSQYSVGTGFLTTATETSKQIDLIIYNNRHPLIFNEGNFIIATPHQVVGIIEVKTNLEGKIKESFKSINENLLFLHSNKLHEENIFSGIFAYQGYESPQKCQNAFNSLEKCNIPSPGKAFQNNLGDRIVNHIALSKNGLIIFDRDRGNKVSYSLYYEKDMAYAYFLLRMLLTLDENSSLATDPLLRETAKIKQKSKSSEIVFWEQTESEGPWIKPKKKDKAASKPNR